MIGIQKIATYIPDKRLNNLSRYPDVKEDYLRNTVGVLQVSQKEDDERPADLCKKAYDNLIKKINLDITTIDLIVVITQHSGVTLPAISTEVHGILDAKEEMVCFDLSLGCSGFVQGLSIVEAYMNQLSLKKALMFNVETLSANKKGFDTELDMLFGDAATVTLLEENGEWCASGISYGTSGKLWKNLMYTQDGYSMNGLRVYDFVIRSIPKVITNIIAKNNLTDAEIDMYAFHQASQRTLKSLIAKLKLDSQKVPIRMANFGNTGSCSIPILIEDELENKNLKTILICGFGAGMAWAASILKRKT